ncbi:MAG: hypothetical protein M1839_009284 [Geoglossum umbratile]|nr:MAG: hypothetical protein M1839_009284 [Geoglossum umbratile]
MTEFIGARISLVSRSDIRYVGTLHEISSENSTVALEQVTSYGTEGRRANPEDEIPASESVYEYIVFRGSDVKDLRIEEPAKPKENKPPQVPNDPAILGSGSRPPPTQATQVPRQQPPYPPQFQQQPPYQYFYPPPGPRFQGGPQGPGFQNFQYGAPPPWYPPPPQHGQGYPQNSGPFSAQPPTTDPPSQQQPMPKVPPPAPIGPTKVEQQKSTGQQQPPEKQPSVKPANEAIAAPPAEPTQKVPTPPIEAKPDVIKPKASPAPAPTQAGAAPKSTPISAPTGPKSGRIMPAVPLQSPAPKAVASTLPPNGPAHSGSGSTSQQNASQPSQAAANAALHSATQAATAAVAAAMAKLPPAPGQKAQPGNDAVDNLARKVNEMRTNNNARPPRQPASSGHTGTHRGGRGGFRGNNHSQNKKVDVPVGDFDFELSNAKFNKQDLVKEAIASASPINGSVDIPATNGSSPVSPNGAAKDAEKVLIPVATYNKSASFFDNISSDTKDRDDPNGKRPGGREWRGEEQKKNLETFGQGSVDNGYRGGFRGRGRGRGWGNRGRGGFAPRGGRGNYRGGRNNQTEQNGTVDAGA